MAKKHKKTNRPPAKKKAPINTLSLQRRIYPEVVDKIAEIANSTPGMTPTKITAGLLCRQLCLPEPKRRNAAKDKKSIDLFAE